MVLFYLHFFLEIIIIHDGNPYKHQVPIKHGWLRNPRPGPLNEKIIYVFSRATPDNDKNQKHQMDSN